MKNIIKKILKEEFEDFEWTKQIDPLESFGEYFEISAASKFVRRDIDWWEHWVDDVYGSYTNILEEFNDVGEMIKELINSNNVSKETEYLANELYTTFTPTRQLNGMNYFEDMSYNIKISYEYFGDFARTNNLTMLEVMDIFKQWLYKRRKEGRPLHKTK